MESNKNCNFLLCCLNLMDFTTKKRKNNLVSFMTTFTKQYMAQSPGSSYITTDRMELFDSQYISKGIEGFVTLSNFKASEPQDFNQSFVIKHVNLLNIKATKDISKLELDAEPKVLYNLFLSDNAFNKPSLTEIITHTLTNQMILQNICPNFSFNYYWDYENKTIALYNEYVNDGDFENWAKKPHTPEEWKNALFQITVALAALKRYFGMLHTDFHTQNILVQKVTPGGYWTYIIDGFKYHLPNLGYVFLIHDFGFSWIPKKLYIKWHERDTLRYITRTGLHFYDISTLLKTLLSGRHYKLPKEFKAFLKSSFYKEEILYNLSYKYYQKWSVPKSEKYKSITTDYKGLNTTLSQKIHALFYTELKHLNSHDIKLETYSLDKPFNKNKLPLSFKQLVK